MILNKHLKPNYSVQRPVILNGTDFATFILYGFVLNSRAEITIENMAVFSAGHPCPVKGIPAAPLRLSVMAPKYRQFI